MNTSMLQQNKKLPNACYTQVKMLFLNIGR